MTEAEVENPAVTAAEKAGYFVRKVAWVGRVACPDRIFAREDRGIVFIEFKATGKPARKNQAKEHQRMRDAGIEVYVCDNVQDALRILWLLPGPNGGPVTGTWRDRA